LPPHSQLVELAPEGWLSYTRSWLTPEAGTKLMAALLGELQWQQRALRLFGKQVHEPRLVAWAGELAYRYSGQTLEPRPRPACLEALWAAVEVAAGQPYNHVLINRYRNQHDAMGWHADDEPELGQNPVICSVSLGATRNFLLKPKAARGAMARRLARELEHGSLLIMGGALQHHYRHAVLRQTPAAGERINLTFRLLQRPPAR